MQIKGWAFGHDVDMQVTLSPREERLLLLAAALTTDALNPPQRAANAYAALEALEPR